MMPSSTFEEIAREHARGLAAVGRLAADRVEAWWSADGQHEIDLVGVSGRGIGFVGEAKWSARPLPAAVLARLDDHVAALPGATPATLRLLYGRAGCVPTLSARRDVRCFTIAHVYGD